RVGVDENAVARRDRADAQVTQAELADDHGQPDDRASSVTVRDRTALVQVQVPAGPTVLRQRRTRGVLDKQSVEPLGGGGVIPLGGRGEERTELGAGYAERVKIVGGAGAARVLTIGH